MAELIERPIFSEGEILRAEDLNASVDHGRARAARHARQQHRWGIVQGLELEATNEGDLLLKPGVAIDVRGREIIVPQEERLPPDRFNVPESENEWFPLFLLGFDERMQGDSTLSACGGTASSRRRETYELQFGRPQDAVDWDSQSSQPQPLLTDGPDIPFGQSVPRVLIGFVQWTEDKGFTEAKGDLEPREPTKARRFAGLRGSALESHDSSVLVLLGETEKDALTLKVGKDKATVARIDRQGNLLLKGKISLEREGTEVDPSQTPTSSAGDIRVISGVMSDGLRLPLPPGVTMDDIQSLQTFVRPIASGEVLVTECGVGQDQRLRCLARQLIEKNGSLSLSPPGPWSAEYLVIAKLKKT